MLEDGTRNDDHLAGWIWEQLEAREGEWRTPVLATSDSTHGVDARTIVLRHADRQGRSLHFHTARDSGKVYQLAFDSRCCLVIHDSATRRQVRLRGRALPVRNEAKLDITWQQLADWQKEVYALQRQVDGRENFAAYDVIVDAMHLLILREDGRNEAMEFHWKEDAAAGQAGGWLERKVEP